MADLDEIARKARAALDARNAAREASLPLSREVIRTCANSIRAVHRGELDRAREMLVGAREALAQMRAAVRGIPELYGAGYFHDCQKEFAEASAFLALVGGEELPVAEELEVEYPAYLNGLGETVGELRRHTLDVMRTGDLADAEAFLKQMDDIYHVLVTLDYPDALTGGLRRTTDSVRGIIEKTRGELTVALRQEELRVSIQQALSVLSGAASTGTARENPTP